MKRELQIGLAVLAVMIIVVLFLCTRTERYKAPPPRVSAPQDTTHLNPGIEELKAEILTCGDDKTCVRKAMVNSMKKK